MSLAKFPTVLAVLSLQLPAAIEAVVPTAGSHLDPRRWLAATPPIEPAASADSVELDVPSITHGAGGGHGGLANKRGRPIGSTTETRGPPTGTPRVKGGDAQFRARERTHQKPKILAERRRDRVGVIPAASVNDATGKANVLRLPPTAGHADNE